MHSDLIKRIETADGPSRELDVEIAKTVGTDSGRRSGYCNGENGDYYVIEECSLHYTSSIDAAMTLVPEGMGFYLSRYWVAHRDGAVWSAEITTGGLPDHPRKVFDRFDAATPALAICAAALRARED